MAPIVPIHIVPVYAKENCTIDPTKITTDERSTPAVFVGLPSPTTTSQDAESKAKDEEATEEIKEILLPTVPIIPTLTTPTPLEKPADATTTGVSQEVTEVVKEELAKPTPTIAATDAPVTPAVVVAAAEEETAPAPPAEETSTTTETSQKVEPESIPPQEKPANDTTTASDSKGVEHTKSMSEGSTTVKSSSRPTTPTGPTTTKSKASSQLGKGSPSSKEHSSSHSMDELGVRKGNGSTMGKKKRHSTFLGKIKHMFHHHHHEKEGEKGVH